MNTEMKLDTDCKTCRSHMADLLLDANYAASHAELSSHLATCTDCRTELNELHATFALLDEYAAPEPSPYFDSKLHARLREVQTEVPEGLWSRMRSFLLFSTGRSFQPAVATALALVLVAGGGGTFWQLRYANNNAASPMINASNTSAAVNDLTVLDNNAQAEQQMGQLLDQSGSEDDDTPPTT
jgi:hypothetical protein